MFTNLQLVDFVIKMKGNPYWYGCCVYRCTNDLLSRKAKQYPAHYTSSRMSKYKKAVSEKRVCADCVGLIKGFMWTNGGAGVIESVGTGSSFANSYQANGCPDKSANGMLSYCKSMGAKNGKMNNLPEVPGIAVFKDGHVGVYIGNGKVVEAKGFNDGIIESRLSATKWTAWAYLPFLSYVSGGASVPAPAPAFKLGDRDLKNGLEGEDVKELQVLMNNLGFTDGSNKKLSTDGKFGPKTKAAVEKFEKANKLPVNGVFTVADYKFLTEGAAPAPSPSPTPTTTPSVGGSWKVTGDGVNVRTGPSTSFKSVGKVNKTDTVGKLVSTGWSPIYFKDETAWISDKYFVNGAVTGNTVNIRTGPSTGYKSVGLARLSERFVKVITADWTPVLYKGEVRWIFTKYIK